MNGLTSNTYSRERRQRRRQLTGALPASLGRHAITVVDLSLGGLGFRTSARLQPFDRYWIRIPTESGEVCASGYLVWCRIARTETTPSGEVKPIYRGGVRFEPLAAEDSELLLSIMHDQRPTEAPLEGRQAPRGRKPVAASCKPA